MCERLAMRAAPEKFRAEEVRRTPSAARLPSRGNRAAADRWGRSGLGSGGAPGFRGLLGRPSPAVPGELTVGRLDDPLEREADRLAERILDGPVGSPDSAGSTPKAWPAPTPGGHDGAAAHQTWLARAPEGHGNGTAHPDCPCHDPGQGGPPPLGTVRRAPGPVAAAPPVPAPAAVGEVVRAPGRPLDPAARGEFEGRLGVDLGAVRLHDDTGAARSAAAIGARAYTVGTHLVFGAGQYAPRAAAGRRLLAHELAHVLQQGGAPGPVVRRAGAGGCAAEMERVDEQRDEDARAGRLAHSQIQAFFSRQLAAEVPVPRATKDLRAVPNPPSGTPVGRIDLWQYGGGLSHVEVGEIKSINGARYAPQDVQHYLLRLRELVDRFRGGPQGPPDQADRTFDQLWFDGRLGRGAAIGRLQELTSVVPAAPPTPIGMFTGDPRKELRCELRPGGAVVYWCVKRRRREEERESERVQVPAGERERRRERRPGRVRPAEVALQPEFAEAFRALPAVETEPGRRLVVAVPSQMFVEVTGAAQAARLTRIMRVDLRGNVVLQYHMLSYNTLGAVLAPVVVTTITLAVIAAVPVAVSAFASAGGAAVATAGGATVATGAEVAAASGVAAAGGGGVVVPLFATTAATAQTFAKAAAVVIVAGTLLGGASEAQAAERVQQAMRNPELVATIDVTDVSGGMRIGSWVTVNGKPYRVIALLES